MGVINFTADIWSSGVLRPYFAITGHWIAMIDGALKLKSALLAFHRLRGAHTGKRLAQITRHLLNRVGIIELKKVCYNTPLF
jgi:hypothetical protein